MKYGIILYQGTENLGDDILTYSAKKYLPQIDYYIDRESLNTFVPDKKEKVNVIFNGYFLHNKLNWPPSPYMNPFFVGFHYTDDDRFGTPAYMYLRAFSDYFKKYEPVGARDYITCNEFINNDIESYFSGCLTLTLDPFEGVEKNNKILLTDVSQEVEEFVRNKMPNETIECLTHAYTEEEREESRRVDTEAAYKLREPKVIDILKKYQAAKLVITSRLHCALPCLALGTPVIVITKDTHDFDIRVGSYLPLLHHCTEEELLTGQFEYDLNNPKENRTDYLEFRKGLVKSVTDFIVRCEDGKGYDHSGLPEVEQFKTFFVTPTKIVGNNIYKQLEQQKQIQIQLAQEICLLNERYKNTCLLAEDYGKRLLEVTGENQKLREELCLLYDKLLKNA